VAIVANDILTQVSFHLVEKVVKTTLGTAVSPGPAVVTPPSMVGIYNGAMMIVGSGATLEIITASSVTLATFTATFTYSHAGTDPLYGATFPSGQPPMFLFTQTEMLNYLVNAQQDFLLKVRLLYSISQVDYAVGEQYFTQPNSAIRIERIARKAQPAVNTTLGATITTGGILPVTATVTPGSMLGIVPNAILSVGDTSNANGAYTESRELVEVISTTLTTFTASFLNSHAPSDPVVASATWIDLFNTSTADLDMLQQNWAIDIGDPTNWFQDATSATGYGVYPNPAPAGTLELWYSDRGPDSLALTDTLSTLDIFTPALKYKVLEMAFLKDGEQRDTQRAKFCTENYKYWVMAGVKFMRGVAAMIEEASQRPTMQTVTQ
jgi:hypothetical protein